MYNVYAEETGDPRFAAKIPLIRTKTPQEAIDWLKSDEAKARFKQILGFDTYFDVWILHEETSAMCLAIVMGRIIKPLQWGYR